MNSDVLDGKHVVV
jgi:hypothetical protein